MVFAFFVGFIQRKDVIEQLRAEKFDVYMGEQLTLCGSLYSHLLGIKTHVWISRFEHPKALSLT